MREKVHCAEFEELAVLYAAGELNDEDRAAVELHAGECSACGAVLTEVSRLCAAAAARREPADRLDPSGLLLAQCRSELAEALDDAAAAAETKPGWWEWLAPGRWAAEFRRSFAFHPGWSAAALLLVGALGGTWVRAWYRQSELPTPGNPMMTVSAASAMSDDELAMMGVEGIRWEPQDGQGAPQVEVQLRSEHPTVVQGSPDDATLRRLLTYVVGHGQQFDPAVRLDSLDALRGRISDPQVRAAICEAARSDANPAVRLKAVEMLRSRASDPQVRDAMLAALADDDNSGVRVEAVNSLFEALSGAEFSPLPDDGHALEILRDRMQHDPNQYVRQRSAAALGQLVSFDGGSSGSPQP